MIYDVLINMPTETNFATLPGSVQAAIRALRGEWPSGEMPGTRSVNGRRITHALVNMEEPSPLETLEAIITQHNLDWQVLAMQAASLNDSYSTTICLRAGPESMEVYLSDLDDQGTRPVSLEGLHCYAGHPRWVGE